MSLEQLKTIRSQRVERGHTELQRIKAAFAQAELKVQEAKEELKNYSQWRLEHQKDLFDKLQSGSFTRHKMDQYNLELTKLKEKELTLAEKIPPFEVELKASWEKLDKAKEFLQAANKDMEKVEEFLDMQKEKDKEYEEKQEEELADELSCYKSSQSSGESLI